MNIELDGVVVSHEGTEVGSIAWVVVDLTSDQLSGIVVQSRDDPQRFAVACVSEIESADEDRVVLTGKEAELETMMDHFDVELNAVGGGLPEATLAPKLTSRSQGPLIQKTASLIVAERRFGRDASDEVTAGKLITCTDGQAGHLRRVIVDDYTGEVTELGITEDRDVEGEIMVPYEWVSVIDENGFKLNCHRKDLKM